MILRSLKEPFSGACAATDAVLYGWLYHDQEHCVPDADDRRRLSRLYTATDALYTQGLACLLVGRLPLPDAGLAQNLSQLGAAAVGMATIWTIPLIHDFMTYGKQALKRLPVPAQP